MLVGLYGAGLLGRTVGRYMDRPFLFVDDTPSKLGTVVDGHEVTNLERFEARSPAEERVIYVCIYQPGFSFLRKRAQIQAQYPGLDVRPFTELFLSCASGALPYLFFEPAKDLEAKEAQYKSVADLLADDVSRLTLQGHLAFRRSGRFEDILWTPRRQVPFLLEALSPAVTYVDAGAFDGDTAEDFVAMTQGRFGQIRLVEPDPRNLARARQRLADLVAPERISFHLEAISATRGEMGFNALGSVASSLDANATQKVRTVLLSDFDAQGQLYIKLDVEGSEVPALRAAFDFIASKHPILGISVYHRPDDLLDAAKLLAGIPNYNLYLRCHGEAGEDLMLYAIARVTA